jgi:hypothetical protein
MPAGMFKAETRMAAAEVKEKSLQSRVRVIGKIDVRWMFFRACLVPKTIPEVSESALVLLIAAAA